VLPPSTRTCVGVGSSSPGHVSWCTCVPWHTIIRWTRGPIGDLLSARCAKVDFSKVLLLRRVVSGVGAACLCLIPTPRLQGTLHGARYRPQAVHMGCRSLHLSSLPSPIMVRIRFLDPCLSVEGHSPVAWTEPAGSQSTSQVAFVNEISLSFSDRSVPSINLHQTRLSVYLSVYLYLSVSVSVSLCPTVCFCPQGSISVSVCVSVSVLIPFPVSLSETPSLLGHPLPPRAPPPSSGTPPSPPSLPPSSGTPSLPPYLPFSLPPSPSLPPSIPPSIPPSFLSPFLPTHHAGPQHHQSRWSRVSFTGLGTGHTARQDAACRPLATGPVHNPAPFAQP
jgi:hypothetical protein